MEGTPVLFKLTSELYSLILSPFGEEGNLLPIQTGAGDFFSSQTSRPLRVPPNLCPIATGGSFPDSKAAGT